MMAQGDSCDPDDDNDGILDQDGQLPVSFLIWISLTLTATAWAISCDGDDDGDGVVDIDDFCSGTTLGANIDA